MKPLLIIGSVLLVSLGLGCGSGGSSSSPSAPTAATPTPAQTGGTVTVNASSDRSVGTGSGAEPVSLYLSVGQVFQGRSSPYATASALKFDLPVQVTGRTVTKAMLRLAVFEVRRDIQLNGPTATMAIQLRANAFTSDWDPASMNWNAWTSLGYQRDGEARAAAPNSLAPPVDFDVTTIVRNWASGTWKNYGMRLAADTYSDPGGDSYGISNFYSLVKYDRPEQRPQLIIEYQ